MTVPLALFMVFTHILSDFLVTDGAIWRIPLYKTKIPLYKPDQPTPPKKPTDFCMKGLCPKGVRHISCNNLFWGDNCPKPRKGVNMNIHGAKLLAAHNLLRTSLSNTMRQLPKAKPMKLLRWDEDLSTVAMRVTNFCNDDSLAQCVNIPRSLNVARTSYSFESSESAISSFIFTVAHYFETSISGFPVEYVTNYQEPANATHRAFANIVYYKTRKVGCGMLVHKQSDSSKVYVTCLYNKKIKPNKNLYELA